MKSRNIKLTLRHLRTSTFEINEAFAGGFTITPIARKDSANEGIKERHLSHLRYRSIEVNKETPLKAIVQLPKLNISQAIDAASNTERKVSMLLKDKKTKMSQASLSVSQSLEKVKLKGNGAPGSPLRAGSKSPERGGGSKSPPRRRPASKIQAEG